MSEKFDPYKHDPRSPEEMVALEEEARKLAENIQQSDSDSDRLPQQPGEQKKN